MGLLQSRESDGIEQADASTKVIRIERSEIPEEYKTVGISHNVVDRVLNFDKSEDEHIKDLKKQLIEEQEENIKLREHIRHLTESEPALVRKATENFTSDPEEQKHTVETRLDYIEKKYVSDHSENFCKANEEELMDCIKKNRNKVLNCSSFAADFKKCVDSFREKILKEVPQR